MFGWTTVLPKLLWKPDTTVYRVKRADFEKEWGRDYAKSSNHCFKLSPFTLSAIGISVRLQSGAAPEGNPAMPQPIDPDADPLAQASVVSIVIPICKRGAVKPQYKGTAWQ